MKTKNKLIKGSIVIFVLVLFSQVFSQDLKTVAILEFEGLGISKTEVKALTNRLRGNLVKTGEYEVIERGKMNEILDEQGFQMSGCTSEGCMVEAGQLLGVQFMLAGSISLIGSTYSVEMRFINIETGKIIKSANYDMQGKIDKLLTEGMQKAVDILLGKEVTPVVTATAASMAITSNPTGAEVFIGDVRKGVTPINIQDLQGNVSTKIRLNLMGYNSYEKDFTPIAGQNAPLNVTLQKQMGWLTVTGTPNKAKLIFDGNKVGKIPLKRHQSQVGSFELTAKRPEYKTITDIVNIQNDQVTMHTIKLEKMSKAGPLLLSAIIPGTGQFIQRRFFRGLLFTAASAGIGFMAYKAHDDVVWYKSEYDRLHEIYVNSSSSQSDIELARDEMDQAYDYMKESASERMMFVSALGGIWTINIIDIIF